MRAFFVFFGISVVVAAVWGWNVVQGVRVVAARTDTQMRTLAWAAMAYADANDGLFPTSNEALKSFGVGPDTIRLAPGESDGRWPTTRAIALKDAPPAELDASFRAVVVSWGPDPTIPPYLKPDGLPTLIGTNEEVNGWLDAMRKRQGGPTPAPPAVKPPA
jgi:hypothetical protein